MEAEEFYGEVMAMASRARNAATTALAEVDAIISIVQKMKVKGHGGHGPNPSAVRAAIKARLRSTGPEPSRG